MHKYIQVQVIDLQISHSKTPQKSRKGQISFKMPIHQCSSFSTALDPPHRKLKVYLGIPQHPGVFMGDADLLIIVNPFEKYARNVKLDHFPKFRGEKLKNMPKKPPPSYFACFKNHLVGP